MDKKYSPDIVFWVSVGVIGVIFSLNFLPSGISPQIVGGVVPVWAESGEIVNSGREAAGEYVFYRFDGSPGGKVLLAGTDMPERLWGVFDVMGIKPGQIGLIKTLRGEVLDICVSDTQAFIDPEDDPTAQEIFRVKMPLKKRFGPGTEIAEVISQIKESKL